MVKTPDEFAQLRAKDVKKLLARFPAARRRAIEMHLEAAERYLDTARVHDRAAAMYEDGASGRGAKEARLHALDHEAAAARNRDAAEAEFRRAAELVQEHES